MKCRGKAILICPGDRAVYSTEVDSCVLSLFKQTHLRDMCKRMVLSRTPQPRQERYASVVLYYLAEPQTLHLQCEANRASEVRSMVLEGAGLLQSTGPCYLTLEGLQLPTVQICSSPLFPK